MQKFAIGLAYDGTDFCGWQPQKGTGKHSDSRPSIEGELVAAIQKLCGETVGLVPSGRTDAGVHASGQVAHFSLENTEIPEEENLLRGINHLLPDSIELLRLSKVEESFRAQASSRKQYSYYFLQGPSNLPHIRRYVMWNRREMDHQKMQQAIGTIIGSHDFAGFASAGANVSSTIREIYEAEVTIIGFTDPGFFSEDSCHHLIKIRLVGSGFLKQMVRTIAGTLKQIGEGQRPIDDIDHILQSKDREIAGATAPANGLWLDRVWYNDGDGNFWAKKS